MSHNIKAIIGAQAAQYYQPNANNRPTDTIRRQTFAGLLPSGGKGAGSTAGVFSSPVASANGGNFTKQFFG